jgi:hypothetical protein
MNRRLLLSLTTAIMAFGSLALPMAAATTQDVTVTATPSFIGISNSANSYNFGAVSPSSTPSSAVDYFTVTNSSTVSINVAISVTAASWSGGAGWTHSDTATAGADTAGLLANPDDVGGWGTGDVIIKNASPNNIKASLAASTNFDWGIKLVAPTSFTDGVEKSITVRLTATAA